MVAAAIGGYWKIESEQDQRDSIMEMRINQQKTESDNLLVLVKELTQKVDESKKQQEINQIEILQALRKLTR